MTPAKPVLIDLYCGVGGATVGYQRAGFHVIGVDIESQPDYPGDEFHQADAIEFIQSFDGHVDLVHASPPCQRYSNCQKIRGNEHPDLIPPTREALQANDAPYVIENVPGSPLRGPIELCGCMFPGLGVYRPRLFEMGRWTSEMRKPEHSEHSDPVAKMGRAPRPGERMHVVGNYSGAERARQAMGIGWTKNRKSIAEAIPPAYTDWPERCGGSYATSAEPPPCPLTGRCGCHLLIDTEIG